MQESILKQVPETMRLDMIDPRASVFYRDADIVIFDSWHWWVRNKVHNRTNYFQEGDHLYPKMEIRSAYKKALTTWRRWVDKNINSNKTQVVFRGHSCIRNQLVFILCSRDGKCNREGVPITSNETYREKNPPRVKILEETLRRMKTPVIYLNVTKQTYYRADAHPALYTRFYNGSIANEAMKQDCGHWCLPGVPDTWNELLYISLLKAGKASFAGSSSAVSFASVAPSSNSSLFKELVKNSTQTNETNYSSIIVPVGPPKGGESVVRTKAAFNVTSSSFLSNTGGSNDRKKQENGDDCNIFDGEWVWVDDRNGRIDQRFLKWKWQWQSQQTNSGYNNNIPSILNATDFLERLRGKKDYNCTTGFVWSPFLVYETQPLNRITQKSKIQPRPETMRLDLIDPYASAYYRDADTVVFDSWHWWVKNKVHNGENYFQEGDFLHRQLDISKAFKKALTTWKKWIDKNIDSNKTQVVFRGHSISHFRGGPWNKGGSCSRVTEPLMSNEAFIEMNPSAVKLIEGTIRRMKTPVIYLNVTKQTYYRADAHPSIYTRFHRNRTAGTRMKQDCGHWCLPGVPDTWNELLYISLMRDGKGSFAHGGKWNTGGICNRETEPIASNETYRAKNPLQVKILEDTLRRMKTPVLYLNISELSYYRTDGHPSLHLQYSSDQERTEFKKHQDCVHWCLPGIPDTWNELLYISLMRIGKGSFAQ
ncbi:hypothetical protein C5167_006639 [Papaver somniferum]|uniref:Trichome birefringence-like C-terminal domain-containing protein n=1 Tax=Papaver somniferum TaxID=3469 RepID=A0A4Y7JDZ6_PAPSO|nr:hypothetical protein C5167_006639 [Papaver somniferum]